MGASASALDPMALAVRDAFIAPYRYELRAKRGKFF